MTENDTKNDRLLVKSRPRPGGSTLNQSTTLIAPPPSVPRKNSTTSNLCNTVSEDLISFATSPTVKNSVIEFEGSK